MAAKRRVYADCRLYPSEKNCSLYVAGTEDEVFEVALHHAITSHGHQDTPQFRKDLRSFLKDEPSTK
jgi:hypothetical protein